MEALKLKTLDDLLASPQERVELIDGEIVRRPMARAEHAFVQANTVAYQLDRNAYRVVAGFAAPGPAEQRARIPPFEAVEIDLGYRFGR